MGIMGSERSFREVKRKISHLQISHMAEARSAVIQFLSGLNLDNNI